VAMDANVNVWTRRKCHTEDEIVITNDRVFQLGTTKHSVYDHVKQRMLSFRHL
jgi:hypothetical protein